MAEAIEGKQRVTAETADRDHRARKICQEYKGIAIQLLEQYDSVQLLSAAHEAADRREEGRRDRADAGRADPRRRSVAQRDAITAETVAGETAADATQEAVGTIAPAHAEAPVMIEATGNPAKDVKTNGSVNTLSNYAASARMAALQNMRASARHNLGRR